MNYSRIGMTPWLMTLATTFALSPLLYAFSPIKGNVITFLSLLFILIIKGVWISVRKKYFYGTVFIILMSAISAVYWEEILVLQLPKYFILSFLVVSVLTKRDITSFVEIQTALMLVILIGAILGTVYAYYGGNPQIQFFNPDKRPNWLYLTTLTNSQFGNYIRPSGIFDEAGALSFITCFVAALRHSLDSNKKVTWVLLALGLITSSVAHFIYMLMHAIQEVKGFENIKIWLKSIFVVIFFIILMILYQPTNEIFSTIFLNRFSDTNIGTLGQDRIKTLINAIGYININTFIFGLNSDCAVNHEICATYRLNNYGFNPLTLLVHWGVVVAFPYYLVLAYLLINSIRKYNFVIFGVFLLLLQRPYVMSYGYSLLIFLTVYVLVNMHTSKRFK